MRTTVQIDDDVYEAARSLARAENKALGHVLSRLARRGLAPRASQRRKRGFPVFEVTPEASPITLEAVRRALDEA
jgi:predicted CopG family antitoxin